MPKDYPQHYIPEVGFCPLATQKTYIGSQFDACKLSNMSLNNYSK